MQQVKSLLEEVLQRDRILKNPKPRVLMQNFGESSVDFRVLFWIESMDLMLDMRNEVMDAIFQIFKDNHIELPFPKQDLYIKSMPEELSKKEDKKNPPTSDAGENSH